MKNILIDKIVSLLYYTSMKYEAMYFSTLQHFLLLSLNRADFFLPETNQHELEGHCHLLPI